MSANGLKDLLDDLAEDAHYYDVCDRAWADGQRLRRRLSLAPVAGVVVVLALAGALLTVVGGRSESPVDDLPAIVLDDYPARPVIDGEPRPLPATGPVGRGLIVRTHQAMETLYTRAGDAFALPAGATYELSPDGRWLVGRNEVGDFTGMDRLAVEGVPIAWSPDSRWLAVGDTEDDRGEAGATTWWNRRPARPDASTSAVSTGPD